jgi:tetrahydromethanopterin S-methyltransferase subunit G
MDGSAYNKMFGKHVGRDLAIMVVLILLAGVAIGLAIAQI